MDEQLSYTLYMSNIRAISVSLLNNANCNGVSLPIFLSAPQSRSIFVAIFIWLITFVVVVPFGLLCAFHQGINWSKLKHLPQDVPL